MLMRRRRCMGGWNRGLPLPRLLRMFRPKVVVLGVGAHVYGTERRCGEKVRGRWRWGAAMDHFPRERCTNPPSEAA